MGEKPVVALLAGDRVLYARAGTVAYGETGANLSRRESFFEYVAPQPAGLPVSLFLTCNTDVAAGRAVAWQVPLLPLGPARLDGAGLQGVLPLRVTGAALRTLSVRASGKRTPLNLGRLAPGLRAERDRTRANLAGRLDVPW